MAVSLPHPYVIQRDGSVDAVGVQENFAELAKGATVPRIVSGGKQNIATAQTTNSTAYTLLATPDVVTVVLPTDGKIEVTYHALIQNTVGSNARAAIFLGANQVKVGPAAGGAPAVAEATGPAAVNLDAYLATAPSNATGWAISTGAAGTTEVTTGQLLGHSNVPGSSVVMMAAAGTYDISIQFKNAAAGSLTVSKRHLWVVAWAFA